MSTAIIENGQSVIHMALVEVANRYAFDVFVIQATGKFVAKAMFVDVPDVVGDTAAEAMDGLERSLRATIAAAGGNCLRLPRRQPALTPPAKVPRRCIVVQL